MQTADAAQERFTRELAAAAALMGISVKEAVFDYSGQRKVWLMPRSPLPTSLLFQLRALPDGVRMHREFFRRHGLSEVHRIAFDPSSGAVELFFDLSAARREWAWLARLAFEIGGAALGPELPRQIEDSGAGAAGIGLVFLPERQELGRWRLYLEELSVPAPAVELACSLSTQRGSLERVFAGRAAAA